MRELYDYAESTGRLVSA
jgi:hypothetical protein